MKRNESLRRLKSLPLLFLLVGLGLLGYRQLGFYQQQTAEDAHAFFAGMTGVALINSDGGGPLNFSQFPANTLTIDCNGQNYNFSGTFPAGTNEYTFDTDMGVVCPNGSNVQLIALNVPGFDTPALPIAFNNTHDATEVPDCSSDLNCLSVTLTASAPTTEGQVQVQVNSENTSIGNVAIEDASVTLECVANGNTLALTHQSNGLYQGDFDTDDGNATNDCTDGSALRIQTISATGMVQQANVNFANNYDIDEDPTSVGNVNYLALQLDFSLFFSDIEDSGNVAIAPSNFFTASTVSCFLGPATGTAFCREPINANPDDHTIFAPGHDRFDGSHTGRSAANDPQEVVGTITLVAETPGSNSGGSSPGKIAEKQSTENSLQCDPFDFSTFSPNAPGFDRLPDFLLEPLPPGASPFMLDYDVTGRNTNQIEVLDPNGNNLPLLQSQIIPEGFFVVVDGFEPGVQQQGVQVCLDGRCNSCPSFQTYNGQDLLPPEPGLGFTQSPVGSFIAPEALPLPDQCEMFAFNLGITAPIGQQDDETLPFLPIPGSTAQIDTTFQTIDEQGLDIEYIVNYDGEFLKITKSVFLGGQLQDRITITYEAVNGIWQDFMSEALYADSFVNQDVLVIVDSTGTPSSALVQFNQETGEVEPITPPVRGFRVPGVPDVLPDLINEISGLSPCITQSDSIESFTNPFPPETIATPVTDELDDTELGDSELFLDTQRTSDAFINNLIVSDSLIQTGSPCENLPEGIRGSSIPFVDLGIYPFLELSAEQLAQTDPQFANFLICDEPDLGVIELRNTVQQYFQLFSPTFPLTLEDLAGISLMAQGEVPERAPQLLIDGARNDFERVFGRAPRDDSKLDQAALEFIALGLRPPNRDLSREEQAIASFVQRFNRIPESDLDWNIIRAIAYADPLSVETQEIIQQGEALLGSGTPCPPEYVAALNAKKAELEAKAAALEAKLISLDAKITDCETKVNNLKTDIQNKKQNITDTESSQENNKKAIEENAKKINDLETELAQKQKNLEGENIETTTDPKGALDAAGKGAAITFDGVNWTVATGDAGVESLIDKIDGLKDLVNELKELGKHVKAEKKRKTDLEKEKANLEQEKQQQEKELADLEQQLSDQQSQCEDLKNQFDSVTQQIVDLNAIIDGFNAVAAECDVRAGKARAKSRSDLELLKRRLQNMPDDLKEEVIEELTDGDGESDLTEGEKSAFGSGNNSLPGEDNSFNGTDSANAADMLDEAMRNASQGCKEGDKICRGAPFASTKQIEPAEGLMAEGFFETMNFLRGSAEYDKLADAILQSGRDAAKKNAEAAKPDPLGEIDKVDKFATTSTLLTTALQSKISGSSFSASISLQIPAFVYGLWTAVATESALGGIDRLIKNKVPNPAIEADLWVFNTWKKDRTVTSIDSYVCVDGVYQKGSPQIMSIVEECVLVNPIKRHPITKNLPDYSQTKNGWRNLGSIRDYEKEKRVILKQNYKGFGVCVEAEPDIRDVDC